MADLVTSDDPDDVKRENYNYLREHRRDLFDACVSVGHAVTCYNDYHDEEKVPHAAKIRLGALAESRGVEIVVGLLREARIGQAVNHHAALVEALSRLLDSPRPPLGAIESARALLSSLTEATHA